MHMSGDKVFVEMQQADCVRGVDRRDACVEGRVARERAFFDGLASNGFGARSLIHRLGEGFYEKSERGRLWSPVWKAVDLVEAAVLDYGCGTGSFSRLLADRGARVYGVDISPQLVAQARAARLDRADGFPQFLVCDAHHTPFPESSFDFVFGNGVLHHLDLDEAYVEIARVLKPDGKAFFQEPLYHHPALWLLRRSMPGHNSPHEKPLSFADIERAKRYFRSVSHREHFLFAVCAAPAHALGKSAALAAIGAIDRFDQLLMRIAPPFRRLAWLSVLELDK
jgi:SAM-dependent methyltransferase